MVERRRVEVQLRVRDVARAVERQRALQVADAHVVAGHRQGAQAAAVLEALSQHHHARAASTELLAPDVAAEHWCHTECREHTLGDAPYLYWRLDETSGTAIGTKAAVWLGQVLPGGWTARLLGAWDDAETRAFNEAMSAFNGLPDDAPSYLIDEFSTKPKPPR